MERIVPSRRPSVHEGCTRARRSGPRTRPRLRWPSPRSLREAGLDGDLRLEHAARRRRIGERERAGAVARDRGADGQREILRAGFEVRLGETAASVDLRSRIIAAWQSTTYSSWEEIAETYGVGRATVNRLIRRFRATGSVAPAPHAGGLEPLIPEEKLLEVFELVQEQPDRTVEELAALYSEQSGVTVSRATMGRALERLGLSRKKKKKKDHRSERT
jgi:transposase